MRLSALEEAGADARHVAHLVPTSPRHTARSPAGSRQITHLITGAKDESESLVNSDRGFIHDGLYRRVRRESQGRVARVTDVTRAERVRTGSAAELGGWSDTHDDLRLAANRPYLPHEHSRAVKRPIFVETRTEVGDLDSATFLVVAARDKYRRIRCVLLLYPHRTDELDRKDTGGLRLGFIRQQRAEDRITIEARKAAPHDSALRIDQRGDRAIAYERKVEGSHVQ